MADTSMATKYDLIQKERVCDDIWLCTTRPSEKCYKPCKVHNPQACDGPLDGAGLPGVEWDDDDVFEADEEVVEECEDEMTDTSFSDNEVWDSDVDALDDSPPTPEQEVANQEMDRWMQVADIFYNQESAPSMAPSYGIIPPPPNGHFQGYFPWNAIYPSAGGFGGFAHPMMPVSFPFPGAIPHAYAPATQQDLINAHNMRINNDPWPLISRTATNNSTNVHPQHQEDSRGWDELIDEQERYQEEMAAAMAAQCVGATEECETSMEPSYVASSPAPRFATHPQNTVYSTDFWRQTSQMMPQVDQTCS